MAAQRSLRSNASIDRSTGEVSRSQRQDFPCNERCLAEGSAATTATRTVSNKRERRSRMSGKNPEPVSAKKARIQTPEPWHKALNDHVPSYLTNDELEVSLNRPAAPYTTNALLVTPRGSRLVTYNKGDPDASPSETRVPTPITTTSHILDEACAHLIKMEPTLQPLIEKHHCRVFCPESLAEDCDPFKSLCSSIMSQQVSGAAASSIKRKFIGLFCESLDEKQIAAATIFPTPAQVAARDTAFLRQAGLSGRKAEYIKGLAQKFASGELSAAMLINASDEEVLEKLTAVRGLGKWSVEMFACFGLKRMDILSTGDLGVQYVFTHATFQNHANFLRRGMAAFMGKDVKKLRAKGGGKVSNFSGLCLCYLCHVISQETRRASTFSFLVLKGNY